MMELVPVTQAEAFAMIVKVHRHLKRPPEGWVCGVGLAVDGVLVGAGLIGRPVAPKTSAVNGDVRALIENGAEYFSLDVALQDAETWVASCWWIYRGIGGRAA